MYCEVSQIVLKPEFQPCGRTNALTQHSSTRKRTLLQNADDQVLLLRYRGKGGVDSSSAARRQLRLRGRQAADLLLARGAQGEDHVRPAAHALLGWG